MIVDFALFIASVAAGVIAAISSFGIGSVLTPIVSIHIDTKLAVAVVSILTWPERSFDSSGCGNISIGL
jgi:hypothetical protein